MRTLQKTFLLLAMFIFCFQALRLIYIKCFENSTSVLDKYEKSDVDEEIERAESLDELLMKYDRAHARFLELDQQRKGMPEEEREKFTDDHSEEFQEKNKLRLAITDWEDKSREIRVLRVFWILGLLLILGGAALYWRGFRWLGMALMVPGFAEMLWWTSPSFHFGGAVREFDRLMNNRLFFTFAAIALLVVAWVLSARLQVQDDTRDL